MSDIIDLKTKAQKAEEERQERIAAYEAMAQDWHDYYTALNCAGFTENQAFQLLIKSFDLEINGG
jgi:hypothetical protein